MIAFVRGQVAAVTLSSAVLEVGEWDSSSSAPRDPRHPAARAPGHAADQHGRARGQPHPLRVPRRGRGSRSSSWCRPPRGRPQARPAVLAVLAPDDLRARSAATTSRPSPGCGIGQKGAQRIILELKDRIGPARGGRPAATAAAAAPWRDQVHQGLVGLGWSTLTPRTPSRPSWRGEDTDVGTLLRAALRTLSKA